MNLNKKYKSRWYKGNVCKECSKPVTINSTGFCKHCSHKKNRCIFWRGNGVGYHGIHKWLYAYFGRANHCDNPKCEGKSSTYQWAKLKEKTYQRNRENFIQLCTSCHRKYDFTEETRVKQSMAKKGMKLRSTPIFQKDINGNIIAIFDSAISAQKSLNILRSSICEALKGHHKTAGGFKWEYVWR